MGKLSCLNGANTLNGAWLWLRGLLRLGANAGHEGDEARQRPAGAVLGKGQRVAAAVQEGRQEGQLRECQVGSGHGLPGMPPEALQG